MLHFSLTKSYRAFLILLALVSLCAGAVSNASAKEIIIGLRAHSGVEQGMQRWQPTVDYLNQKIPGFNFILVPFDKLEALSLAAKNGELDYVITNPASYVEMEIESGSSRILTLINRRQGKPYTQFGSVIFVRADRKDLQTLDDINGKTLMAVSEPAFGGWRMAWGELLEHGINPKEDLKELLFAGGNQQDVVHAVENGKADVGVVRTDMLERMADDQIIRLADFRALGLRDATNFPYLRSTKLYPEWAFAKLPQASILLSRQIGRILLGLPSNSAAAQAGMYMGWSVPLNYQPVHDLLKTLQVRPYKDYGNISFTSVLSTYRYWIAVIIIILAALIGVGSFALLRSRQLSSLRSELLMDRDKEIEFQKKTLDEHAIVSITDVTGKIIYANEKFCEISGYKLDEVIGQNHRILKSDEHDKAFYDDLWQTISSGKPWHGEIKNHKKGPGFYWVKATIVPFLNDKGKPFRYVAVRTDITDRKKAETIKSEFISTVSHELRTPLTSIKGSLSLINSGVLDAKPEKLKSLLHMATRNTDRLLMLVNDLLDFQTIESGEFTINMEPMDIRLLIDNAIEANVGYGNELNITFAVAKLNHAIMVDGDMGRLVQALSNLMSNAAKFSPSGETVTLSVTQNEGNVSIAVKDNGQGIPKEFQEKIFQRFSQADSSDTRQQGGTGLGLNITKTIIETHGGHLSFDTQTDAGSTFYITLPVIVST